jgi:hypothetical protein
VFKITITILWYLEISIRPYKLLPLEVTAEDMGPWQVVITANNSLSMV